MKDDEKYYLLLDEVQFMPRFEEELRLNMTLSIIGIFGGLLCACADLLLDLKGNDNKKLGKTGFIESNWIKMDNWRFITSIIVAMFAVPMYSAGIISLGNQIGEMHQKLGFTLKLAIMVGGMGGFFIHAFICVMPIMYKDIMKDEDRFELADTVLGNAFHAVIVPFVTLYFILMLVPTGIVCYGIITRILDVPMWFVCLNPVVFQIVGWILRAAKREWFCDFPSVCAASLGLAMYGVIGVVNLL